MSKQSLKDVIIPIVVALVMFVGLLFFTKNIILSIVAGVICYFAFYFYFHWIKKDEEKKLADMEMAESDRKNSPEARIGRFNDQINELNQLLQSIKEREVREKLKTIYNTLINMLDHLKEGPNKIIKLTLLVNDSLPTLIKSTHYFSKRERYNLLDDQRVRQFKEYLAYNAEGFVEMFEQLLEETEITVGYDQTVSVHLLKVSGFDKDSNPSTLTLQ